eukprot:262142-Pyramimonas_sp.AAC.1
MSVSAISPTASGHERPSAARALGRRPKRSRGFVCTPIVCGHLLARSWPTWAPRCFNGPLQFGAAPPRFRL